MRGRLARLIDFFLLVIASVSTIFAILIAVTVPRSNFIASQFGATGPGQSGTAPWWFTGFVVLTLLCGVGYALRGRACVGEGEGRIREP
jgi:hypothetical protein